MTNRVLKSDRCVRFLRVEFVAESRLNTIIEVAMNAQGHAFNRLTTRKDVGRIVTGTVH